MITNRWSKWKNHVDDLKIEKYLKHWNQSNFGQKFILQRDWELLMSDFLHAGWSKGLENMSRFFCSFYQCMLTKHWAKWKNYIIVKKKKNRKITENHSFSYIYQIIIAFEFWFFADRTGRGNWIIYKGEKTRRLQIYSHQPLC